MRKPLEYEHSLKLNMIIISVADAVLCLVHVIWTERRMTNLVLNVCFDFFSRHENYISK